MKSLTIRFKKVEGSPTSFTVERHDGSKTYTKLHTNFEIHDIAHYAVEKQLGFKNAFYGLLSQGHQIDDFQLPKADRPKALWPQNIPQQALVTEHLVNLLTIDFMDSGAQMDILETFEAILKDKDLPFPESLDREKLIGIQNELSDLMAKWNALESGKELKMELKL